MLIKLTFIHKTKALEMAQKVLNIFILFSLVISISKIFYEVNAEEIKDGFYINISGTLINAIKNCNKGVCNIENAVNNGIYIDANSENSNGVYTRLIKCTTEKGCISEIPTVYTYYLDQSSKENNNKFSKLIKCNGNDITGDTTGEGSTKASTGDEKITCSIIDNVVEISEIKHYISDFQGETDSLITCKSDGCILENKDITGYFINSDVNDGRIIVCESEDCDILQDFELENECTKSGILIFKKNKYYICLTNSVKIEISNNYKGDYVVEGSIDNIFTDDEDKYAIISLDGYSVFLNKDYKTRYAYVNISSNGKYKVIERNNCPKKVDGTSIDEENILEISGCVNGICNKE